MWGRISAMGARSRRPPSMPMPMPNAHAHAGTCSHSADAAGHEAASSSSTSDESDTCLDDSSLAGYRPCQTDSIHKGVHCQMLLLPDMQRLGICPEPVILLCKHKLSVCLTVAVHA